MAEGDRTEQRKRPDVRIADVPDRHRFEASVDGELVGFLDYVRLPGLITYTHTEVFESYEGQGIGSELARVGLDDARYRGARVLPACSFVADWIGRHPEYKPLVEKPAGGRRRLG